MIKEITCPNCEFQFDMEGLVSKKLQRQFEQKLAEERQKLAASYLSKEKQLHAAQITFAEKRKREGEIFKNKLNQAITEQKDLLQNKMREEFNAMIASQRKELSEKNEKIKLLRETEIEMIKLQRKMAEVEKDMELKMQRKLVEEQANIEETIAKRIYGELELKMLAKDKMLEDQRKLIVEMKRKSEQGSMQMQGEIQELAIERILKDQFPIDKIEEVPKGIKGADTIQTVMNQHHMACGKIIYESKRTKQFSHEWIEKLKRDQRLVQAEIAVIVTQTLPKDMDRFGQKKGVWICNYQEFKSLVFALREILIRSDAVRAVQENKGDKIELLYDFLTGNQFKMRVTGIIEAFESLKMDLEKEKRAMQSIWKKREKQLESVILNTAEMYGSIKGIGGKEIPIIQQFELPGAEEQEFNQ